MVMTVSKEENLHSWELSWETRYWQLKIQAIQCTILRHCRLEGKKFVSFPCSVKVVLMPLTHDMQVPTRKIYHCE